MAKNSKNPRPRKINHPGVTNLTADQTTFAAAPLAHTFPYRAVTNKDTMLLLSASEGIPLPADYPILIGYEDAYWGDAIVDFTGGRRERGAIPVSDYDEA